MRLRHLQARLDRIERRAAKRAEAEFKVTIDQGVADHYVQLKARFEQMLAEHKAGCSIDIELGRAICKELIDIRHSNELPTTEYAYKSEAHHRLQFFKTRRGDSRYIPLSEVEEAQERQLILLTDIDLRGLTNFMPEPLSTPDDDQTIDEGVIALCRLGREAEENAGVIKSNIDRYKAKLERYLKEQPG